MISKRFRFKKKNYFSSTTNVGLFQVSSDQVDNLSDKYDPHLEAHQIFVERVRFLTRMSDSSMLLACGTEELFETKKEPEIVRELKESLRLMKSFIYSKELEGGRWFSDDSVPKGASEIGILSLYIKIQTLCPSLNFELARKIYDLKGAHYFGPLSNKKNSRSCGTRFSLCAPIFRTINSFLFKN